MLEVWFIHPSEHEDGDDVTSNGGSATAASKAAGESSDAGSRYLLSVPREQWEEMLDLVNCQILSEISTPQARAYLLSESSLFIYETQLVIKTCGTTTLLNCLPKLLELAANVGLIKVDNIFYNRQSFFFPQRQVFPHQSFESECSILDSYFRNGGAYVVGRVNGPDYYHFYNAECRMSRDDPAMREKDSTLEILMTGLDRDAMRNFYFQEGLSNKEVRDRTGISDFFPNALIDDFMFQPFGYSLNALMDDGYYTIHITPQDNCSFVSFETNVYMDDYTELINKVLRCFKPDRFIIVHLANTLVVNEFKAEGKGCGNGRGYNVDEIAMGSAGAIAGVATAAGGDGVTAVTTTRAPVPPKFRLCDDISLTFDHYILWYNHFQRASSNAVVQNEHKRRKEEGGSILKSDSPFFQARADLDDVSAFALDEEVKEADGAEPAAKKPKLL